MSGIEEMTVDNRNDSLFTAYMRSFEESAQHTARCAACQDDKPCAEGDPLHAEFFASQDAWWNKDRAERKQP
ncbi:hypothetical protein ABZV60_15395 [Streptomyces sp. NPDC004787]|uniref:hypothetical protein n=1 Tax=Streptomyces sp. NPDC004787 TaxID=3154291 RepID=UPI0033A71193